MEMAIDPPAAPAAPPAAPAAGGGGGRQSRALESQKLEQQLLRVPLEHLKRTLRSNQRIIDRDVGAAVLEAQAVCDGPGDAADAVQRLSSIVSRLHGLKRKVEEGGQVSEGQVQRCRARIDHLEAADTDDSNSFARWDEARQNRILVDFMLRMSYHDSAIKMAKHANIEELVDIDVFLDAKKIVDSLQNKDVSLALAWCGDNKSRLKKSKSKLEFLLRLQEFIELVKKDEHLKAITYARKYLSPWGNTHMKELQRVTATLVFKSTTTCALYKGLFEDKQWDSLVEQFKQEFSRLFGMTVEPLLNIYLQAGLSALRTPLCYEGNCPREDPLAQEQFRKLAEPLPMSKQHHSKLVCHITKEPMDSENPPLVLPNGYVYGTKALEEMAKKNGGTITCPRTGDVCNFTELVKAFIT